jgi:RNA polymerase sigma factor (sigma-70 family)
MSETSALLRAYHQEGDDHARKQLVELYLPLVESFTRRYARSADEHDDLYQVGCIGLINAIDRFDLERGDELAAFAVPNIAGEIRRYLRDRGGSLRLPRRVLELRSGAVQAQGQLRAKLGREPTTAEVAVELGASEDDVALALDAGAAQAVELQPGDIGGAEAFDVAEDRLFLSEAFRGLDERERQIMYLRYIRDVEPDAIAAELNISRRQVARNTEEALKKLRDGLERPGAAPAPKTSQGGAAKPKMTTGPPTDLEHQIDQPYHIELVNSEASGGSWSARVDELPGCTAEGSTPEEAAARVQEAMKAWMADALAAGREVPKPRAAASHSGRLLVRMPQSLHSELARAAEHEEVSLNQFVTSSLASAVNWRGPGVEPLGHDSGELGEPRGRTLRRALMVNVALLVLIAVLAIALLVVAVSRG